MTIGYFGGGKTHIVEDGKPICGLHLRSDSEYQWCSALGQLEPECQNCYKKMIQLQQAICKILGKKFENTRL